MMRLPRRLHPGAWWLWAIGLVGAASQTTNPLLLGLVVAVAGLVVVARRPLDGAWARSLRFYALLALFVICLRIAFRVLFGDGLTGTVVFTVPTLPLPDWAGGLRVGGPVTIESLLAGFYDGARLAAIIICVGAVNSVADPRRLLRSLPRALYDMGTAAVVAVSLVPQLFESLARVRRARRLRGDGHSGIRALPALVVPVLEDSLARSLDLAAAMSSRGYGRLGATRALRALTGTLMLGGIVATSVGAFAILSGTFPTALGTLSLAAGLLMAGAGLASGGRAVGRTVYRPDPWSVEEWAVACSGLVAMAGLLLVGNASPGLLRPSLQPLTAPVFSLFASVAVLVAALPAWLSPPLSAPIARPAPEELAG